MEAYGKDTTVSDPTDLVIEDNHFPVVSNDDDGIKMGDYEILVQSHDDAEYDKVSQQSSKCDKCLFVPKYERNLRQHMDNVHMIGKSK